MLKKLLYFDFVVLLLFILFFISRCKLKIPTINPVCLPCHQFKLLFSPLLKSHWLILLNDPSLCELLFKQEIPKAQFSQNAFQLT